MQCSYAECCAAPKRRCRSSSFCRTVGALDRRGGERVVDIAELSALLGKFVGKGESAAFTRAICSKPPTRFLQMTTSAFPFLVEPAERMLEPGNGTKRRHRHRKINLVIRAGALQRGGVAVAITLSEALALVDKIEATDARQMNLTLLLQLEKCQDFLHQRAAGVLAFLVGFAENGHRKRVAGRRHQPADILADIRDAAGRDLDLALRIAHLPADRILVVVVGGAQPLQPGDIGLQSRLLHQPLVAGGDGLRHGELIGLPFTEILKPADRCITAERGRDEAGLALVVLPHGSVKRPSVA